MLPPIIPDTAMHEDLRREHDVKRSSERSFGVVFSVVFAIVGLWPVWGQGTVRLWALVIAAGFLALALFWQAPLRPLNRLWLRFGLLLHSIVNPIIMGLLFYGTVVPTGLLMRLAGKDPLRLKRDPQASSYWIVRTPPGPAPESMSNQF